MNVRPLLLRLCAAAIWIVLAALLVLTIWNAVELKRLREDLNRAWPVDRRDWRK